jgi:hypothetical protein
MYNMDKLFETYGRYTYQIEHLQAERARILQRIRQTQQTQQAAPAKTCSDGRTPVGDPADVQPMRKDTDQ